MSDLPQQAFREEAYELLAELETALLELEERPDDMEVVGQIFRAMHTIKGSGAMFGFNDISNFTHEVETVYDLVRNGCIDANKALVEISLQARDHIEELLNACCSGTPVDQEKSAELVAKFQQFTPETQTQTEQKTNDTESIPAVENELCTYRVSFTPQPHILQNGTKISSLLDELAELGSCRSIGQMGKIPALDQLEPEQCYVSWNILLTSPAAKMPSVMYLCSLRMTAICRFISLIPEQRGRRSANVSGISWSVAVRSPRKI